MKGGGRCSYFSNSLSHRAGFQWHARKPHSPSSTKIIRKRNYRVLSLHEVPEKKGHGGRIRMGQLIVLANSWGVTIRQCLPQTRAITHVTRASPYLSAMPQQCRITDDPQFQWFIETIRGPDVHRPVRWLQPAELRWTSGSRFWLWAPGHKLSHICFKCLSSFLHQWSLRSWGLFHVSHSGAQVCKSFSNTNTVTMIHCFLFCTIHDLSSEMPSGYIYPWVWEEEIQGGY